MEYVKDEKHVCDWSKLDEHVVKIAKAFNYSASMFGTFDFDYVPDGSEAVQKQRRARRKADPGIEKRPTAVTQSEDASTKTTKVEQVLEKIQSVSCNSCILHLNQSLNVKGNFNEQIYQNNGGKAIPYFQLVIDPTNMMYTFDNTFQISFLFRDGLIAFVKDDEGLAAIKPIDANAKLPKPAEMTSFTSSLSHDVIQVRTITKFEANFFLHVQ